MDDESKQLLREIRDLQKEQMELLKANMLPPWLRMRFGVRTLPVFMTLVAVVLGIIVFIKNLGTETPLMRPVQSPPWAVPSAK